MGRHIRRVLGWGISVALLLAVVVGGVYLSGVRLPVYANQNPVAFQNWNKTRVVEAEVLHDSEVWRSDGRVHLNVNLQMPAAVQRLQSFLDGGRTELVACGPQKLFLHSLVNGQVGIDGDLLTIRGVIDMELDGLVGVRGGWPLQGAIRFGHDRTTVRAQVVRLSIGEVPQQMIDALLEQLSQFAYTREQIFGLIARGLSEEDAAVLAAHRDTLDLAFEEVVPAKAGDVIYLDAVVSVNEAAAFKALGDRFVSAPAVGDLAEALGPSRAHAQFNLRDLTDQLEDVGKQLGKELLDNAGPLEGQIEDVLKDPLKELEKTLSRLTDCKVSF